MLGALGEAKARDVLAKTIQSLSFPAHELERWQALLVLETIAAEPGLIGITARFAKARAVMRWPAAR